MNIYRPPTRHLFSDAARRRRRREVLRFAFAVLGLALAVFGVVFAIGAAEPGIPPELASERRTIFLSLAVCVALCVCFTLRGDE